MDDSICLHRSYSLNRFLILWLFSVKLWDMVEFIWAGLQWGWVEMWVYSALHWGQKWGKAARLLRPPCSFSSFSYNPSDKTQFATVKTGLILEKILKKFQLKPLSPSHQPKNLWENGIRISVVQCTGIPLACMIQFIEQKTIYQTKRK